MSLIIMIITFPQFIQRKIQPQTLSESLIITDLYITIEDYHVQFSQC